ncbi:MAG TPA: M20/M25/M40 family metallo-hydrolase [Acidobacteriaceae bacterium]
MTAAEHLSNLIQIPSVSALSNRPVIAYAGAVFNAQRWTIREDVYTDDARVEKVNLIAAPPGQNFAEPAITLAFLCHTDTVTYANNWQDALRPVLRERMLHGCGACDVKGFLACLLAAVESGPSRWANGLRIVLTADEEIGCLGSKRLITSGLLKPRHLVIGEPTSLHPARSGKGYCLARVTIVGREAHSSLPDQGLSAIYAAAHFVSAVEQFAQDLTREEHVFFNPAYTTMNIGTIHGGSAKNIVPGRTELLVEWRPIPGQPADRIPDALQRMLAELEKKYKTLHTFLDILRQDAGFETSAEAALVQYFASATDELAISIPFGSEANMWSSIADEIVVFGPGDMSTAHSDRECVSLHELEIAVQVLSSLMQMSFD